MHIICVKGGVVAHYPDSMPVESFIGVLRGLEVAAQQQAQVALLRDASRDQPGRFLVRNRDDPVVGYDARREAFSDSLHLLRQSIADDNEAAVPYAGDPYLALPHSVRYMHSHAIIQSAEPVAFPFTTETGEEFGVFVKITGFERRQKNQFPLAHSLAGSDPELLVPEQAHPSFTKQLARELGERIAPSRTHEKALQELCTVETSPDRKSTRLNSSHRL